ncbi:hypothetical protein evm_000494 [Chilo suppressalis]|nr:hypothetical protein evm_000494 [Chilo suppressalis]
MPKPNVAGDPDYCVRNILTLEIINLQPHIILEYVRCCNYQVLKRLQKRYGGVYTEQNVILSGTHTHSTPGGFLMDFLFDLPILGFVKETYAAYIIGIYKSIVMAHSKLAPARVEYGEIEIVDANINRSPTSYLRNPPEERAKYKYDTDKTLAQLRFLSPSNSIIGVINWYAVHPTSMNNTNKLISSDNVGYAAVLMEKALNGNNTQPGKGNIVCAFASTNLGDVSPNTRGPRCEFSRAVCDQESLLCKGKNERCFASGPGRDMFDSTRMIATKLFEGAMKVLEQPGEDVTSGPVGMVHQFVEMPKQEAYVFDPLTDTFNTMKFPYEWQPRVVSCSVARVGGALLAAVPGEFTTMSGRRMRRLLASTASTAGATHVILAGLSNVYSDYIATYQEYQAQRYEAASTIFGPHTLEIYLNKYKELTEALLNVSGHPRNSIRHGRTYMTVEKLVSEQDDAWTVVATDADWDTKYIWKRNSKILGTSEAEVEWEIPEGTPPGTYRLHHYGNYKYILGGIYPYHGFSDSFEVT